MKKINRTKTNAGVNYSLKILTILAFGLIFVPFNKVAAQNNMACGEAGCNYSYSYTTSPINNPTETNNPKPTINSINPKSSNVGVGTKTITITGSGFVPSSSARINAANRPTTFIDDSHLLVQINGNDTTAYRTNGGFFISVWNGAPGGGFSNALFFVVNSNTIPAVNTNTNNGNNYNSATTNFNDTNNNQNSNSYDTFTDTPQAGNGNINSAGGLAATAIFGSNSFLPSGLIQWILFAIIILLIIIIVRKIFGARENYENSPLKHD